MATTFKVEIDWDHNGTWTDETAYLRHVRVRSGFERDGDPVAGVGRCTLVLDNTTRRFSPGYAAGPLAGKLLPRRAMRLTATDGVETWTLFRGFIEAIQPDAGAYPGDCRLDCVDGIALLARQRIGVTHATSRNAADAVAEVVSAAYAPPATSYADNGDALAHYGRAWQPEVTTAQQALDDICRAVYGRFWIARDGTATYWSRTECQDPSVPAALTIETGASMTYLEKVQATQAAHLLGYWPLNESSGADVADLSGNDFDGTAYGVTWGQQGIGDGETAALFDGINDYVSVDVAGLLNALDPDLGTLALWVKMDDWSDLYSAMAGFAESINNRVLLGQTVGDLFAGSHVGAGTLTQSKGGSVTYDWVHLAVTWDRAGDSAVLFIDGVAQTPDTGVTTWSSTPPTHFIIGRAPHTEASYHPGCLAHVAVWDVVLSDPEIAALAEVT